LPFSSVKADIYALLGIEYLYLGDFESAKESYKNCLIEDDHDYAALYNIIHCFVNIVYQVDAMLLLNKDYFQENR
jgi:Tfp pilus assembly protein PilF